MCVGVCVCVCVRLVYSCEKWWWALKCRILVRAGQNGDLVSYFSQNHGILVTNVPLFLLGSVHRTQYLCNLLLFYVSIAVMYSTLYCAAAIFALQNTIYQKTASFCQYLLYCVLYIEEGNAVLIPWNHEKSSAFDVLNAHHWKSWNIKLENTQNSAVWTHLIN